VADPADVQPATPAVPVPESLAPPAPYDRETALTYKPLSPLALAGLGVAVVYTLLIVVGGALSFFTRSPWLLPWYAFLIPALAVFLCVVGRVQIRSSEGTRSGLALANWGLILSVVVGSCYAAYYGATRLVVGTQSRQVSDEFLETLQKGDLNTYDAFYLGTPPPRQSPPPADLRSRLELQYNVSPNPAAPGELTSFGYQDYVRILQQTGKQARWECRGVRSWVFEGNSYKVTMVYDVETPLANFSLLVVLQSNERPSRSSGRQWQVVLRDASGNATRRADSDIRPQPEFTKEGLYRQGLGASAEGFAENWARQLNNGELEGVYLETVPPDQRNGEKDRLTLSALRAHAPLEGWQRFRDGSLIKADPIVFWADEKQRKEILAKVGELFKTTGPKPGLSLNVLPLVRKHGVVALCEKNNDEVVVRCDVQLALGKDYVGEARLHVVCDPATLAPDPSTGEVRPGWYIRQVEMLRGRTPTAPQGAPAMRGF
jgi:hypothetical protein